MKDVEIPAVHRRIRLVPREQLRRRQTARRATIPRGWDGTFKGGLPSAPAECDWSKGQTISFPILGNDEYGDCYYTACCHAVENWCAIHNRPLDYAPKDVVARYLVISGGDNGLNDATMMGEWLSGIIGPHGPHAILAEMSIPSRDAQARALSLYLFGGLIYTASLLDTWIRDPQPGQTWTDDGRSDPNNGHAMWQTGYRSGGIWDTQTWGFNPPIRLTETGYQASDPTAIAAFSLDWFDPKGMAPNGYSYDQLAAWWVVMGGQTLPPNPFAPTPAPAPTPTPVPLGAAFAVHLTGQIADAHGKKSPITLDGTAGLMSTSHPAKMKVGSTEWESLIQDIWSVLKDLGLIPPASSRPADKR